MTTGKVWGARYMGLLLLFSCLVFLCVGVWYVVLCVLYGEGRGERGKGRNPYPFLFCPNVCFGFSTELLSLLVHYRILLQHLTLYDQSLDKMVLSSEAILKLHDNIETGTCWSFPSL